MSGEIDAIRERHVMTEAKVRKTSDKPVGHLDRAVLLDTVATYAARVEELEAALRAIEARLLPCKTCGEPHPWRCSNPKHEPTMWGKHTCSVTRCTRSGSYIAEDGHSYAPVSEQVFARAALDGEGTKP